MLLSKQIMVEKVSLEIVYHVQLVSIVLKVNKFLLSCHTVEGIFANMARHSHCEDFRFFRDLNLWILHFYYITFIESRYASSIN